MAKSGFLKKGGITLKKLFTLKINFGDEREEILQVLTNNQSEIDFMTCFLKYYDKGLERFDERPEDIEKSSGRKKHIMDMLNKMINLINDIEGSDELDLLEESDSCYTMQDLLHEILDFVDEFFGGGVFYSFRDDCFGSLINYKIEDVPDDTIEITRKEAEEILKDKLGMNVFINSCN